MIGWLIQNWEESGGAGEGIGEPVAICCYWAVSSCAPGQLNALDRLFQLFWLALLCGGMPLLKSL